MGGLGGAAMWIIHLIRGSVAPDHATAWLAVQTIATIAAFIAAGIYVWLTFRLMRETAINRETELMLRIFNGYNDLRKDIELITEFYKECRDQGTTPVQRVTRPEGFDDARFRISRYFVLVRRLVQTDYLSEDVVRASLRPGEIDLFID